MYSPRLNHTMERKKKSIFRALKAFLFFCGDRGGVGKGCVDVRMLLAFFSVPGFCFVVVVVPVFPLIGCTDLAQEMKRFSLLMLLPMLSQSDSHL